MKARKQNSGTAAALQKPKDIFFEKVAAGLILITIFLAFLTRDFSTNGRFSGLNPGFFTLFGGDPSPGFKQEAFDPVLRGALSNAAFLPCRRSFRLWSRVAAQCCLHFKQICQLPAPYLSSGLPEKLYQS